MEQLLTPKEAKANHLIARALLHQGDILIQKKELEEAEKTVIRAQAMIGELYSDNHPCITDFNANLIEIYASMPEEESKKKTILIAEKNLEIAKKFYGPDSVFLLKHELSLASNKIGML